MRKLSRRSFLGRVTGGAIVAGSAAGLLADPAEAFQVTDADTGANADPAYQGRGRRSRQRTGITDTDLGRNADPAGRGRGARRPPEPQSSAGTGFFVAADGTILTSNHVIERATNIHVTTQSGERLEARLLRASAATDVAVLKVEHNSPAFLTLSNARNVQSGARVFTVGYPIASILGREPRYAEGTVSALSGPGGDQTFLQISVPLQPGNSGGPLISERGEVIGIVAASAAVAAFFRATGTLPQNLNWAVKSDYAAPMLPEGAEPVTYQSREAAIAAANAAVVYVEVERGDSRAG
jgi:S1-C subfamily serine protease